MKNLLNEAFPFHICTKGYEDKVILIDDEDFRTAQNLLAVCSLRAGVVLAAYCLLNTHFHTLVLARSRNEAERFAFSYKLSTARCLSMKYPEFAGRLQDVEISVIPIDSPRYLRDCIAYILCNALDMGTGIDNYKWSSYRAYFRKDAVSGTCKPVSELQYREIRKLFRVSKREVRSGWLVNGEGTVEPASFCDYGYVEKAFFGNQQLFFKSLGMCNKPAMDQMLVENPRRRWSVSELLPEIGSASRRVFSCEPDKLTIAQKYILLKSVYFSTKASYAQLARCFGLKLETVRKILG